MLLKAGQSTHTITHTHANTRTLRLSRNAWAGYLMLKKCNKLKLVLVEAYDCVPSSPSTSVCVRVYVRFCVCASLFYHLNGHVCKRIAFKLKICAAQHFFLFFFFSLSINASITWHMALRAECRVQSAKCVGGIFSAYY